MRRTATNQPQSRRYGPGGLSALAITLLVTPVLAQDAEQTTDDAALEAPPPPLPAVTPPAPTDPPEPVAAAPLEDPRERPEELIVTGSRVRRADLNAPAPVTTLDRQKIDAAGRGSIGEILQQLPSQSNAVNVQFNNGGDGRTNVNLRGLDANRTLVLLNGRRFVPGGNGADSSVDLNAIPLSIIERIEVLKDGASAVYGSDAIGGVVNIITRRDLSGVEASLYSGAGQHGGVIYQLSATAGEVTDKAGLLFNFEYYNQGDVFAGARKFSSVDKAFDYRTLEETTLGSSAVPQGHIISRNRNLPGNAAWQALINNLPPDATPDFYNDPNDGWRPYNPSGTSDRSDGDQYNYQPENYLLTPQERYNLFTLGHYNILPNVRGYFEGSYTNRRSNQLLAPTPLFTLSEDITVSGQNVYNPFARDFIDVRRRMVEASNRRFLQDIDTFRAVLGLDGSLPEGLGLLSEWRWDAHFIYGRTEGTVVNRGRFVKSRVENALGPSFIDASGMARCGTPGRVIEGCVPLDLFGGVGSITREMLDYISYDGTARGFSDQQIWGADFNGPLFLLLDNPVGLAVGYQHRREGGASLPDPITASGDTTGNKTEPTAGEFSVNAAYAELGLPLAVGVPGVEMLELNAAARWVDFSSFGSQITWKLGARWQLLEHVAFRGTASRSFRAPSVGELFGGQADSFPNVTDPCNERSPLDATTRANCIADGIITEDPNDPPFIDEQAQLRAQVGGNENLDAETADTFTAGVVITPKFGRWTDGLSITVDYFNINIENSIQAIGPSVILSNCYAQTNRQNCDLVQRNPATNLITNIFNLETNIGETQTAGVDFGVAYRVPTEIGRFGLNYHATWLERYDETQANGNVVHGAGVYDLGAFPRFRFNAGLTYGFESFGAGLNMNYVGPFRECDNNNCREDKEGNRPLSRNIESWVGTDLYASYRLSSPLGVTSLSAGINNVADAEPPLIYQGFLANSDAATYDYIGRYFYFRLTQVF